MLPLLTKQHNFIVNKLAIWRRDIRNNNKISDFHHLKEFLLKHKNFEEKDVYPLMDQSLNEGQKRQIISKINEIIKKMD